MQLRNRARSTLLAVACGLVLAALVGCAQTDSGITTKIKAKMLADSAVRPYQISVETRRNVVTLTGNINSQEAKERALDLARNTDGVARVVDMIEVRTASTEGKAPSPHRTAGEVIDDAGITMRVKARLLDDPAVKGTKIDVDTREGVVFLTGTVRSPEEKEKAIRLAQETKGVRDVQANLNIGRS